ncbi:RagB/SusD family nutrient uptake outer membrane protein [Euzebyella marina]|uniref:RagB/SusD family nutrient uptake outer membrane protein n=1 Tax=Euzebyella marina TaxID=1761453 RepID=A0A3G2L8G7_9FLAO|nr:RagB/SusD family nutrient uptake outer membrane protein [Euzebyella marina]AYN68471.1 RagB/SusD family nutrient uptake outer membrane protein [Euzebyella marina]
MKTNRNTNRLIIVLVTMLGFGSSCSDEFLEVPPTGVLADAQVSTADGIDGLLIGAYSMLNGYLTGNRGSTPNNWLTGSILGGDANKGTDPGDGANLATFQRFQADATFAEVNELWKARYEGVNRCNVVLRTVAENIDVLTAEKSTSVQAQARMLRGHFYFDLKKQFNNIVVFDENVPTEEIPNIPNNGDAWAQIEADFQFAYDNLPEQTDAGRVNKWAAAAYMGKAKLYQGKFDEAKDWFDDFIANGVNYNGEKFALEPSYPQIFNAENDNHNETVMDVESSNATGSVNNSNWFDDLNYPYLTGVEGPGDCCGFFQPSFELANSFRTTPEGLPLLDKSYRDSENELVTDMGVASTADFTPDSGPLDPRIDFSIGRRDIPYLGWKPHPGQAWIRVQSYGGPYSPKKFVYYAGQDGSFTDTSSWTRGYATMNYPIIRYADVLLMAAEAEIEAGTLEQARTYVNLVRARAANSEFWIKNDDGSDAANYVIAEYPESQFATPESAREAVYFERKLELSGEGHRFFDLVRWGIADEEINEYLDYEVQYLQSAYSGAQFTPGKDEYRAIPQTQLDLQPGVLTQNPGY